MLTNPMVFASVSVETLPILNPFLMTGIVASVCSYSQLDGEPRATPHWLLDLNSI